MAGCGVRWNDEQRAAATAMLAADGVQSAPRDGAVAPSGRFGTPSAASASTAPGPGGAAGPASNRDGSPDPMGTGSAGQGGGEGGDAASGPLPCEQPSDEVGVTSDTISVGTINTISGPVPGLFRTVLAGAQAYVAYRNATGGVCGREIELLSVDDGADNGTYRAAAQELAGKVLGFGGSFALGDGGGAEIFRSSGMPYVGLISSDEMGAVPNTFSVNPRYRQLGVETPKYRYLYDQGARKVALVYTANASARRQVTGQERPQMEAVGMEIVLTEEVPLSTLSFDSAARAVANSGADYLLFLSDASFSASMARSMADTGYELRFQEYITAYGSNFLDLAGDAAEGVVNWIRTVPDEEPGSVPEQAAYEEWFARTAPGETPDTFSALTWAAAKAFYDSIEAVDGPISRAAVLANIQGLSDYTAGGLLGRIDLGAQATDGCFIAMKVVGGRWTRLHPAAGFLC